MEIDQKYYCMIYKDMVELTKGLGLFDKFREEVKRDCKNNNITNENLLKIGINDFDKWDGEHWYDLRYLLTINNEDYFQWVNENYHCRNLIMNGTNELLVILDRDDKLNGIIY